MKTKGFWHNYYEAKKLSGKEFYKNRLRLIEMSVFSLFIAFILSFVDVVVNGDFNKLDSLNWIKSKLILMVFFVAILFYRYNLYKLKKKKKAV